MAIYVVIMEQGIYLPALGTHTLMTGHGEIEDALQSCSAVILVNPASGAAGLYHFPAGDITADLQAQEVLRKMHAAVESTECHVVYGVDIGTSRDEMLNSGGLMSQKPGDKHHDKLIAHLRALTGLVPQTLPVTAARHASVRLEGGATVIGREYPEGATTDLRGYGTEQAFGDGRIYWSNKVAVKKKASCVIL